MVRRQRQRIERIERRRHTDWVEPHHGSGTGADFDGASG
jgi:hypothetical protein